MKKAKAGKKPCATLTIREAARMTSTGRKYVAQWLRRHAADLLKHGDRYQDRFTGRYDSV